MAMDRKIRVRLPIRARKLGTLVVAVVVAVGGWAVLAAGQVPDQSLRAQTVLRGLAAREGVGGVGGEAIVWSFYTPSHWHGLSGIGNAPAPWADLAAGHAGDRDIGLTRFQLGQQQYWYDLQMALWAGGNPWFVIDFQRPFEDVDDLYLRELGDGQYIYRYDRSRRVGARGSVQTARPSEPCYLGGTYATALGFAVGGLPLSKYLGALIENGWRVDECVSVVHDGRACLRLALLIDGDRTAGRYRLWVAPSFGYAPVRCVYEYFQKENPKRGERVVYVWDDYRSTPGGVYLPDRFTRTAYCYVGGEDGPPPWQSQRVFEFKHLVAPLQQPSVAPSEYFFPVGTSVAPGSPNDVPAEECARMAGDFVEPRAYKEWIMAKPLPEPDPEFNQPLTGRELAELQERYEAAAP